ncbi:hypothetical protein [Streptomyces sp. CFMR 7]|uniref:hypothetical protein n=1 Tax=Streptomyces sp. CFMR 7 TaxID=1649184 RepID=UPI0006AD5B4F|nr:hypothetical protein [Streptomyces sp. CFMR 7]ALC26726.1 aromatic ring-opening dioxygenase LigA [Streptomyces sp. CFMR 7]
MRHVPNLPTYDKDATTRLLCSSVHLDDAFARYAHQELSGDRLTATGLPLGVNLLALARHASLATARTDLRDRRLAWLCAVWWLAVLTVIGGLAAGSPGLAELAVAVLLVVLGCSWYLMHRTESRARAAALEARYSTARPHDLAPEVADGTEQRLRGLRRPNMVPYTQSAERQNPFVGSGDRIKETVWQPIDISRPADAPGGGKETLIPFDAVDLHTYLARELGNLAGLEGLRAQNRLYVLGPQVVYLGDDVLPDRLRPPNTEIPPPLVKAGLLKPGAGMRTYLSLERVGEGGRVIVSMHLRARLQHPSLSWEVAAYCIPPLHARHYGADYLPRDGFERWWSLVRFATSHTWSGLIGAPGRIGRRNAERRRHARELEKARKDISKRHALYDYGTTDSLRERVASWDQLGHSERTDSQDFLHRLQQGVLIATERFLKAHNVDTSSFDQAQQVITTQTYNISGDITGPANIGNNGQISASFGQGAQAPAAATGGGPTH